ncbi:hypothetical protein FocnCong_v011997 [Fusarium oxysporum f. sp. conglutinans]|nr:hypothetical protein FocnCong_v011997 [Fusarium oxysporum f. sp. conglutinans]
MDGLTIRRREDIVKPRASRNQCRGGPVCNASRYAIGGTAKRWFEVGRHSGVEDETSARRPHQEEAEEGDELKSRAEFLNKIQQEDRDQFESEANARIQAASDKWEAERWLTGAVGPRYWKGWA